MFPDRCAIVRNNRQCPNPPRYVVSVTCGADEYMVGVACSGHQQAVSEKVRLLQERGRVPGGSVRFTVLRPVGTDCIRTDPDETIQITDHNTDGRRPAKVK